MTLNFKPPQRVIRFARQLPYTNWKRVITTAEPVLLGAPHENPPADRKSFNPNRMFGVAARRLP